jgi:hypothetical protein
MIGVVQHADGYSEENLVDACVAARAEGEGACRAMWFVEPMAWMAGVAHEPHGRLHCPKCRAKLGSFSWVMGELSCFSFALSMLRGDTIFKI